MENTEKETSFREIEGFRPTVTINPLFIIDDGLYLFWYYFRIRCKKEEDVSLNLFSCTDYKKGKITYMSEEKKKRLSNVQTIMRNHKAFINCPFVSIYLYYNLDECKESDITNINVNLEEEFKFVYDLIHKACEDTMFTPYLTVFHVKQIEKGQGNAEFCPHFHIQLEITDLSSSEIYTEDLKKLISNLENEWNELEIKIEDF